MEMNAEQKARLVSVLSKFVSASEKAYPSGMIANREGKEWTYEQYADDTLKMFGVDLKEVHFELTPEEREVAENRRKERQLQHRRDLAKQRKLRENNERIRKSRRG